MINRTILRLSCGSLVYALIFSKKRELLSHDYRLPAKVENGKCISTCLVAGIHSPLCPEHTAKCTQSSFFVCCLFFFFLKKCHFHIRSLKSQPCFCSATWQVSARCLAFHAQSSLAISFKYTDKQTNSSPVVPLPELTSYLHTSRRLHAGLFHHRADIVLGSGIPVSQRVFV